MKYIPFDFDWKFQEGSSRFFMFAGADNGVTVDLPHDYIINKPRDPMAVSGASSGFYPGGDATYTKDFSLPAEWRGKTVLLNVDGAYMNSEVTLNGDLISLHPYGYTAYTVDLTGKLREQNSLKISTRNTQPNSRWYSGAGLYRCVGMLVGGRAYVHPWDVYVTTPEASAEKATVNVEFTVTGAEGSCSVEAKLIDKNGAEVASAASWSDDKHVVVKLSVENPALWSDIEPNLYTLKWTLSVNNVAEDEGELRVGVRKIEIDPRNGFRLNGVPMKLRGGCIHHDNTLLGSAAYPAAERRKIEKLKAAGYNAIRTAHNPPSTALLDACDELGMLVLDESFDMWRTGKNAMDYHLWFEDWWQRDTESMVKRDRNHLCVYSWSIGNEISELLGTSDGAYWAKVQADFVRSLDPTRPVSASANGFVAPRPGKPRKPHDLKAELVGKPVMGLPVDGEDDWGEQTEEPAKALDIFGYNYMYGRYGYDAEKFPERVIHATETHSFHTYDYWKACVENSNCIGDYIWVAFDNLGEAGAGRVIYSFDEMKGGLIGSWPWLSCYQGDLDLIGDPRPQNMYRRVMWGLNRGIHMYTTHPTRTGKPFYGMGWHWEDVTPTWTFEDEYVGQPVKVQAYADCDEVEFVLNGEVMGREVPVEYKAFKELPYRPGYVEVRAIKAGEVVAVDRLETTGAPAAIRLYAERPVIAADGMDVAYVHAELVDAQGRRVTGSDVKLTASVSGAGVFLAIGSGNPCTEENFTDSRVTFRGKALVCARAAREPGELAVKVTAEGMPESTLNISVK